jgi:hypothetical protein
MITGCSWFSCFFSSMVFSFLYPDISSIAGLGSRINKKTPKELLCSYGVAFAICYPRPRAYSSRSSGFPALLVAFPSRWIGTVTNSSQKGSLFLNKEKGGVTAAGPPRTFTVFRDAEVSMKYQKTPPPVNRKKILEICLHLN